MKKKLIAALGVLTVTGLPAVALAAEPAKKAVSGGGWYAMATALCIAIAAFGGALGQSKAAAVALDGIARNPGAAAKIQTPMIIALALIESLVIYAFVIAIFLNGKF